MIAASVASSRAAFFPAIQGDLPTVVRGEGIYLYDDTGRRFIDAAGGVGCVTAIGHGVAEVADAMAEQLRTLAFTPWSQFQTPRVDELSERIAEVSPSGLDHVVQFNSGSEVTEAAVMLARQYWLGARARGKISGHLALAGLSRTDAWRVWLQRAHRSAPQVRADDPRHAQDSAGLRLPLRGLRRR